MRSFDPPLSFIAPEIAARSVAQEERQRTRDLGHTSYWRKSTCQISYVNFRISRPFFSDNSRSTVQ